MKFKLVNKKTGKEYSKSILIDGKGNIFYKDIMTIEKGALYGIGGTNYNYKIFKSLKKLKKYKLIIEEE